MLYFLSVSFQSLYTCIHNDYTISAANPYLLQITITINCNPDTCSWGVAIWFRDWHSGLMPFWAHASQSPYLGILHLPPGYHILQQHRIYIWIVIWSVLCMSKLFKVILKLTMNWYLIALFVSYPILPCMYMCSNDSRERKFCLNVLSGWQPVKAMGSIHGI